MTKIISCSLPSSAILRAVTLVVAVMSALTGASADIIFVPAQYSSIQSALNASVNGDTILVSPGIYTGNVAFNGKLVALRSTNGAAATTIKVNGGTAVDIGGAAEISGFTITGASASFGAGIDVHGIGTLIKNNIFDGNHQTSGGFGAGIGGNSASPIIDGNIFRHHSADTQHLSGVVTFVNGSSPKIMNNVFEDNTCRALVLTLPAGNMPAVFNNVFVRNTTAVKFGSFPPMTVFRNNIVVGNSIGLELDYPYNTPVWEHNLVWNNETNYSGIADQTGLLGNLSADPMFVNPLGDYHLLPGSPAIDSGSLVGAPDHDFAGNERPQGVGIEMGIFEVPEPGGMLAMAFFVGMAARGRTRHCYGNASAVEPVHPPLESVE